MKSSARSMLFAAAIALPVAAHAEGADTGIELAFMPNTMDVTLLNEGGKFVTVDMKKIAKGEKCRMDKDAVVMKVGPAQPRAPRSYALRRPSSAMAAVRS